MDKLKKCSKCSKNKNRKEFNKNKSRRDGLSHYCRECDKKRSREWRKNNPEKYKKYQEKWRKNNPEKVKQYYEKWNNSPKGKIAFKKYQRKKKQKQFKEDTPGEWLDRYL